MTEQIVTKKDNVHAGQRTAAVWVPNWPVIVAMAAAGISFEQPAVTQRNRRVHVVSAFARRFGVRRNMSLRAAQELCPHLHVLKEDEDLSAREFEFVAQVVEELVPNVEIMRPGLLLFGARGPVRFYGTAQALSATITETVAHKTQCEVQVGVANGILAAILAARTTQVIPELDTLEFLGPRPLSDLLYAVTAEPQRAEIQQFLSLQTRLGIKTFGDLAALPQTHVQTRFGHTGAWAHRLASGLDLSKQLQSRQEPDITVNKILDPPVDRVDSAAFAARQLAEELYNALLERSVTCSRIEIMAATDNGTQLNRTWRTDDSGLGAMSPERITQRVRWQLEGWLTSSKLSQARMAQSRTDQADQPEGEPPEIARTTITELNLTAQYIVAAGSHQEALWGRSKGQHRRVQSAVERVQDLLGPQAVLALSPSGGRTYQERVATRWWAAPMDLEQATDQAGWPGRLPSPAPASLFDNPWDIEVVGRDNRPIIFNNRLGLSGVPYAVLKTDPRWQLQRSDQIQLIVNWAGPWPIRTGWWTKDEQRLIYVQLVLAQDPALLAVFHSGQWRCEGIYD